MLFGHRHSLDGIPDQVNLLDLNLVNQHRIDGRVELESDADPLILSSDQRQGAGLFNELFDALHPAIAVAPPHEFAQATDNLSRAQGLIAGLVQRAAN
jgi:hypothetical protein